MKYKLLFLLFLFFLFCPDVMAINVTEVDNFNIEPKNRNNSLISNGTQKAKYEISYNKKQDFTKNNVQSRVLVFDDKTSDHKSIIYLARDNGKDKGGLINYKNVLNEYRMPNNEPLVTIRYMKVARDINGNEYDAVIKINYLYFEPFNNTNKEEDGTYFYKIGTVSEETFWLEIYKTDSNFVNLFDSKSITNGYTAGLNVRYGISLSFVKADTDEEFTDEIYYPWSISDLDQNDKRYKKNDKEHVMAYNSKYTEGITFKSGFADEFYIHSPLKDNYVVDGYKFGNNCGPQGNEECRLYYNEDNEGRRFWGQFPTGRKNMGEPDEFFSKVLAYQNQATAYAEWSGSGYIGTRIFGVKSAVSGSYEVNKCKERTATKDLLCGGSDSTIKFMGVGQEIVSTPFKDNVTANMYTSCKNQDNFKIDVGNNKYYIRQENVCRPINGITVPIMLTENIEVQSYEPYGPELEDGSVIPGRGFIWDNNKVFNVKNDVNYMYQYFLNKLPYFKVFYEKQSGDRITASSIWTNTIYSDSGCNNIVSREQLDLDVKNSLRFSNVDLSDKMTSVNSNDASKEDKLPLNNNNISTGNGIGVFETMASLKKAYLGIEKADISYEDGLDEKLYIKQDGYAYYIPLKYNKDKVDVSMKDANLSIIGQDVKYNVICKVNVVCGAGLVCPDGDKYALNYYYRSIDVNDPFPTYTPDNWLSWINNSNNMSRMRNSYQNNPIYTVILNSNTFPIVTRYNDKSSYLEWSNISIDGASSFVDDMIKHGGDSKALNSYCGRGVFKKECDQYGGG